jgi:hypothetical protein
VDASNAVSAKYGDVRVTLGFFGCANPDCRELSLSIWVAGGKFRHNGTSFPEFLQTSQLMSRTLLPRSSARQWPDYIPAAIREDYQEACLILNDSPKGAAAMARRCLQGMIRDFCAINAPTLAKEIEKLEEMVHAGKAPRGVDEETLDAIDAVRKVGNIGAHMEKDVNVLIPVTPHEARALIQLIEMLLDDWCVARETRKVHLAKVVEVAKDKADAKAKATTGAAAGPAVYAKTSP